MSHSNQWRVHFQSPWRRDGASRNAVHRERLKSEPETNKKQKEITMRWLIAEAAACGPKLYLSPVEPLVVHTTLFDVSSLPIAGSYLAV
jgi:hypothetical protein